MTDLSSAFDDVADVDMWYDIVIVAGGYLGAELAKNTVEARMGHSFPDEVYGVAVLAASGMFLSGNEAQMAMTGGGLNTVDAAAERFGVKSGLEGV